MSSEGRITFVEGDVMTRPFDHDSFDLITAVAILHHLPLNPVTDGSVFDADQFSTQRSSISCRLTPGGTDLVSIHVNSVPWGHRVAFRLNCSNESE